jgi:hypothetical protein
VGQARTQVPLPHQHSDVLTTTGDALRLQFRLHARTTICPLAGFKNRLNVLA